MTPNRPSPYFTRHLLRAGLQCPLKLYYKARGYPEDEHIKPFLEHAGFNKHYLKKLAGHSYPEAVLVREKSKEAAVQATSKLLKKESVIILEAAFLHQHCYAKVPILIKQGSDIQLVDIQTNAFNPQKNRLVNYRGELLKKWKRYIIDLAFKWYVIRNNYPEWVGEMQLLLPDKTKLANQDQLLRRLKNGQKISQNEDLFCRLDVTSHVRNLSSSATFGGNSFEEMLDDLKERYFYPKWSSPPIGKKCQYCEFRISESQQDKKQRSGFNTCWNTSDKIAEYDKEPLVLDLIGPGIKDWFARDIYLQKNIPLGDLPALKAVTKDRSSITHKQRQSLQVRKAKGKRIPDELIKKPLFEELNRWEFPLHFLDFEAGNYAVPIRYNRKPYHLVVFQFSCHTLFADGRTVHHQWIAENKDIYPNYELIRQLMNVPKIQEGTIVQYSKFEHHALKSIRRELIKEVEALQDAPLLLDWLGNIVERHDSNHHQAPYLADMSRMVKNYYYNCCMKDSLSIKEVVKSVFAVSETLQKKYASPYKSSNFSGIKWYQQDEHKHRVQSPYDILRREQKHAEVGSGAEAMVKYGQFLTGAFKNQQAQSVFDALLKYCELDTLAMVMIYEHWKSCANAHIF